MGIDKLTGSINLSRIVPGIRKENVSQALQDKLFVKQNGDVMLDVFIAERKTPSQWGHTHNIMVLHGKDSGKPTDYIGDMKPVMSQQSQFQPVQIQPQQYQPVQYNPEQHDSQGVHGYGRNEDLKQTMIEQDDLPF